MQQGGVCGTLTIPTSSRWVYVWVLSGKSSAHWHQRAGRATGLTGPTGSTHGTSEGISHGTSEGISHGTSEWHAVLALLSHAGNWKRLESIIIFEMRCAGCKKAQVHFCDGGSILLGMKPGSIQIAWQWTSRFLRTGQNLLGSFFRDNYIGYGQNPGIKVNIYESFEIDYSKVVVIFKK